MPEFGRPLFSAVTSALDEKGTRYIELENSTVAFRLGGHRGTYECFVFVEEEMEQVGCTCALSFRAPEDRRLALAEAVTRANWGLRLGGFDLDLSDGEVRVRIGVDVEGGLFAATMMHNMIGMSLGMCDRYQDAFLRVVYGGMEPAVAIAEAEREPGGEAE